MTIVIRPLGRADLPDALALQRETYPAFLQEGEQAFASRLDVRPGYCLAATRDDRLIGYLLAHGWESGAPAAVDTILPSTTSGDALFIHDLSVSAAGHGAGLGRRLVSRALALAARDGLASAELIAVEGAAGYWRKLGFEESEVSPALAVKVAGYGDDARWMTCPIPPGATDRA